MDPAKGLGPVYQGRRRMNRRVYLAPPSMRGLGSPPCQTPPDMPWPFCSEMPISSNWSGLYLSVNYRDDERRGLDVGVVPATLP